MAPTDSSNELHRGYAKIIYLCTLVEEEEEEGVEVEEVVWVSHELGIDMIIIEYKETN